MALIMFLGATPNEYKKVSWELMNMQVFLCKECGSCMTRHGCYYRKIKDSKKKICINRLCCRKCKRTEAVLPDFLIPYKQYSANEIEAVLIDAEANAAEDIETAASLPTVRRWINKFGKEVKGWVMSLKHLLDKIHLPENLNLMELLSFLIGHLPYKRNSGNLLSSVQIYLSIQAHSRLST